MTKKELYNQLLGIYKKTAKEFGEWPSIHSLAATWQASAEKDSSCTGQHTAMVLAMKTMKVRQALVLKPCICVCILEKVHPSCTIGLALRGHKLQQLSR